MTVDESLRPQLHSSPGITKSRKSGPTPDTVRYILRQCLDKNDYSLAEIGQIISLFTSRKVKYQSICLRLLARCISNLGAESASIKFANAAKELRQKEKAALLEDAEGNENDGDGVQEGEEEEEDVPEAVDPVDYLAKLKNIIKDSPDAYERLLNPRQSRPKFRGTTDCARNTLEVHVTVRLDVHMSIRAHFVSEITGRGTTTYRQTEDIHEGSAAFQRAANIAAKAVCENLEKMAGKVLSTAKAKLKRGLSAKFELWRGTRYIERCRLAFQRTKEMITSDKYAGLYGVKVLLYGSATTGMVLGDSDIDVTLQLPSKGDPTEVVQTGPQAQKRTDILKYLQTFAKKADMDSVWVLDSAKVPVLRYWDPFARVNVDVTISNDNSILLSRFLRKHLTSDVRVWELSMVVKYWAKKRRVCGTPEGFINPIGWTIMAIFFLQHYASPRIGSLFRVKGEPANYATITHVAWMSTQRLGVSRESTPELLKQFFQFFGNTFDFKISAISLNSQEVAKIADMSRGATEVPVFIEQPLRLGDNVVSHVSASSMEITRQEMRRGYELCHTIGRLEDIFGERQRTEKENFFD